MYIFVEPLSPTKETEQAFARKSVAKMNLRIKYTERYVTIGIKHRRECGYRESQRI